MSRSSCIDHPPKQILAVVRQDYYALTNDCIAAALLNLFEYWANAAIAFDPDVENPLVGVRTAKEIESALLGMSTEKHIRKRLRQLEAMGFIESQQPVSHRKSFEYRFMVTAVQKAIDELKPNGQTTVGSEKTNGRLTVGSEKSQRSNDRMTIYKKELNIKRESPPTPSSEGENDNGQKSVSVKLEFGTHPESAIPSDEPVKIVSVGNKLSQESQISAAEPLPVENVEKVLNVSDDQIKQFFFAAYVEHKPSNFTDHANISKTNLKAIKRLIEEHGEQSLSKFVDALIWVREQKDDFWRKEPFSLSNLMSNGKISDFSDKHKTVIKYDADYRARVEGTALSKDPARVFDSVPVERLKDAQKAVEYLERQRSSQATRDEIEALGGIKFF